MSSSRSDWPSAPDFHPEFGFLCPSARRRRGLRLATAMVATTLAIGTTMGFAVAHRTDGVGLAATALPRDQPPVASGAPAADAPRQHESCQRDVAQDLAAFFLNSACGSNKPHAKHGARIANRVATVIIGRADAPAPTTETPAPAAAIESSQAGGGNAEKPADAATAAVERTAAPKKPKGKASASTALAADAPVADAAVSAYASVPRSRLQSYQAQSYHPQSYHPYDDPFRSIAPQRGFAASPARSWQQWP
jgi:hypothetical protein